jgi:hypothetical protein
LLWSLGDEEGFFLDESFKGGEGCEDYAACVAELPVY